MNHAVAVIAIVWTAGLLVFAGRFMNFIRLLYNNLDPTKDFSRTRLFRPYYLFFRRTDARAIYPENLTELGRRYQQQAIQNERMAIAWGISGFVLLTIILAPSEDALLVGILAAALGGFYFWGLRLLPQEKGPY
jgi:hypothetical protein